MTKEIFNNYQLQEFNEKCVCGTKWRIKKEPNNGNVLELIFINCGRQKQINDLLNYKYGK